MFEALTKTFPLIQHPPLTFTTKHADKPTLWIIKGQDNSVLSGDIECLKWQAYLALSQSPPIAIRTDISHSGALENKLPNLFIPSTSTLLPAHHIPQFVTESRPFEGYSSQQALNESRAWISLLEGNVHATLSLAKKVNQSYLDKLFDLQPSNESSVEALLTPPPAPLTGFASLLPANMGSKINIDAVLSQYREAIAGLSERLGTDKWFLGSAGPTALDALAFAYLHTIVTSNNPTLRIEVTKRVNLVAWEYRVRKDVESRFVQV